MSAEVTKVDKGAVVLNLIPLTKSNAGFSLWEKTASSVNSAISHFDSLTGGKGSEVVLELINYGLQSRQKAKSIAKLPQDATEKQNKLRRGESLLISQEEAFAYIPGQSGPTSPRGIFNAYTDSLEELKVKVSALGLAREAGKTDEAAAILVEAKALQAKCKALKAQLPVLDDSDLS